MIAEKGQLTLQQFEDPRTGETIVGSVEARSAEHVRGGGMLGYSMFADADALAIVHCGDSRDSGWLAFPCANGGGRPAGIPTMPVLIDEIPTARLVGGAQLRWRDCHLMLDVALEQRGEFAEDDNDTTNVLDSLVGWQLETTVPDKQSTKTVRLVRTPAPVNGIRRSSARRAEASFAIDAQLYNRLGDKDGLKLWFVLEFDRHLFCLPPEWCTWWFEVRLPRHVRG